MAVLVTENGIIIAEQIMHGIAINPKNGPIERMEHIKRSHEEITLWRNQPFIINTGCMWQVRCLDGKTSDRPSDWELTDNMTDALFAASVT